MVKDALAGKHGEYEMVLTNPPFGKKSSVTIVNEAGDEEKQSLVVHRDDFWASTSNKQLNFLQHVFTILKQHGRAAIVVPDNVLFEGGAGETVRRELLKQADVHTLLRLPTGIFYAQGVKANVLFFDRKPAAEKSWTDKLWIYDLRTNKHFTLKENPLKRADLDDFVACYNPKNRHERKESERFKSFSYEELLKRDKLNLDIFWLKDESLEDSANLPDPDIIAAEIVEDLEAALAAVRRNCSRSEEVEQRDKFATAESPLPARRGERSTSLEWGIKRKVVIARARSPARHGQQALGRQYAPQNSLIIEPPARCILIYFGRYPPPQLRELRRGRLFLQKRQERFVTFLFHPFDWNEVEGGRVNGVALSGGRLRVGKEMAKVGVASFGAHLSALHVVRSVQFLDQEIFRDRFAKRGHAEAAIEFVERSEEWFAGNDIDVDAGTLVIPELVLKKRLGATFPHYEIFIGR